MKVATAPYDQMAAQYLLDQRNAYEQSLGQTPTALQAPMFQPRTMSGAPSMMPMMPTNFFGAPRMNANQFFERGGMGRGPMQNRFMPQVLPSRGYVPGMFGMLPQQGAAFTQAMPQLGPRELEMMQQQQMPQQMLPRPTVSGVPAPDYGSMFTSPVGSTTGGARPAPMPQQMPAGAAPGGMMQGLLY